MSLIREQYESLPYPHYIHPLTDPARLAVIGKILGLLPAHPGAARVLDIGCGAATNLLAMASRMPASHFLGLDFSAPDIASAQTVAAEARLTNIQLRLTDLMAWEPGADEKFDYIIAYGVFSWVPDAVKDRLLQLVSRCLAPNGIACISYMTYPGCKQPEAMRDLLRLRSETTADPAQKVALTHQVLDFLDRAWQGLPNLPHAGYLRDEAKRIRQKEPHFLLLDDLGVERDPCYLLQFTNWAAEYGLRYLGESEFHTMLLENLPPASAMELAAMQLDRLQTEQLLDYVANRAFRCTLLVGPDAVVKEGLNAQTLRECCYAPRLVPRDKYRSGDAEGRFVNQHETTTTLKSVPLVTFITALAARSGAMTSYGEIREAAERLAGRTFSEPEQTRLCEDLLTLFGRREIDLSALPFQPPEKSPLRPQLTALNRALCQSRLLLVTAFHSAIRLDGVQQKCCLLLDGTRTQDELNQTEATKALGPAAALDTLLTTLAAAGCLVREP